MKNLLYRKILDLSNSQLLAFTDYKISERGFKKKYISSFLLSFVNVYLFTFLNDI